MKRDDLLQQALSRTTPWDMIIIGGGATGVGIALDAATRSYSVLLLERSDFGKGTSSRSTKLIHGGVRYLRQGNIGLVRESLRERALLRRNAPHLVHDLEFIVPCHSRWDSCLYAVGFKAYDLLATSREFGRSRQLSKQAVMERLPTLQSNKLRGGVLYHDGQFDDSRLLINMVQTAVSHGAILLNYASVEQFEKNAQGQIEGVTFQDREAGQTYSARARCVINATGPFCDTVRKLDHPEAESLVVTSQGVHVVLPREFLPGNTALMVPRTADGRVMFIIPWHGHVLVGTTDTPIPIATEEPTSRPEEIQFLLDTAGLYLERKPTCKDCLSVFAGVRSLVVSDKQMHTAALSRDHVIQLSKSGLITITGGKWTTYRQMAEECVNRAAKLARLPKRPCATRELRLHGATNYTDTVTSNSVYGTDASLLERIASESPDLASRLHAALPIRGAEIVMAVRYELARNVEDVLARRTRALFLNARAAVDIAPQTATIMARELGQVEAWQRKQIKTFRETAKHFLPLADFV